jgi:hypothetical protein
MEWGDSIFRRILATATAMVDVRDDGDILGVVVLGGFHSIFLSLSVSQGSHPLQSDFQSSAEEWATCSKRKSF